MGSTRTLAGFAIVIAAVVGAYAADPLYEGELIFPLESWHNHGSCIVECPNGDLLACWFHGSGERQSDDVVIRGARKPKATGKWSEPFLMADAPEFPDTNCCMIIDTKQRLWLLWPTIMANTWESALMKYKISDNFMKPDGPPIWGLMEVLHMKPGTDFEAKVRAKTAEYFEDQDVTDRARQWAEHNYAQAADKLTSRLGWFTRAHPKILADGRMLVGLYSDGFSFSEVAITDDLGQSWHMSEPIVGGGNIQPSFAVGKDGAITAYMRDNGPAPNRVHVSQSKDRGETWSKVTDHPDLPNPGAGLELINLTGGEWLCIYNDLKVGRHSLAVSISDDEGKTWKWTRHLEKTGPGAGSFHYPSVIQAADGTLHASYSYSVKTEDGTEGKSIKHAQFDRAWILEGDPK
ncbi:MAG: exo-alpha-sialidase [Candidatus Hydrogenedentota bacterium]